MPHDQLTWAEQVAAAVHHSMARQVGALAVFYPILNDLKLRETINGLCPSRQAHIDHGRIALILTLNRLLSAQPLYHVEQWVEQTILPDMLNVKAEQLYDQRLGRTLDALQPVLGEAWARLSRQAAQMKGIDLSTLHYDTTTFHFEGEYEASELARYGYSRDGKSDCKRAKVSYTVTHLYGLPLLYTLLAGNVADITLPVSNLAAIMAFLRQLDVGQAQVRPLVVSDSKMITPALVAAAQTGGAFFLGPWEADTHSQAIVGSVSPTELAQHPLAYRPRRQMQDADFTPYQGVWRPFSISHQGRSFTLRGLVVWSAGKQRLDEDKRKHDLKALLNRLREIQSHLNTGKYIDINYTAQQISLAQRGNTAKALIDVELTGVKRALRLHFEINRHKLAEAQAVDGRYLLVTNHPDLTADQSLTYFKGQDQIEKRNAVFKGPLHVRPVYLQTDQRIESLVFLTMVGMLAWAIVEMRCQQAGLSYTSQRIVDEFAPLYITDQVFVDQSRLQQIGDVSDFQRSVLNSLRLPSVEHYLAAAASPG